MILGRDRRVNYTKQQVERCQSYLNMTALHPRRHNAHLQVDGAAEGRAIAHCAKHFYNVLQRENVVFVEPDYCVRISNVRASRLPFQLFS